MKIKNKVAIFFGIMSIIYVFIVFADRREALTHPEEYHFGSDAMVGKGGNKYKTLQNYINNSDTNILVSSTIAFVLFFMVFYSDKKNHK